jgi:hypothetical protein
MVLVQWNRFLGSLYVLRFGLRPRSSEQCVYQDPVGRASFSKICSGGLEEPYSSKPALPSSDTGWTRFQPM